MNVINPTDCLIIIKGHENLNRASRLVFNRYGIKLYGVSIQNKDCEFTYLIKTDNKMSNCKKSELKIYLNGIIDCIQSY